MTKMEYFTKKRIWHKSLYAIVLSLILVVFTSSVLVQNNSIPIINRCISKGDATAVSSFFCRIVEVNILGEDGYCSKEQAGSMLETFFKEYPPKMYTMRQCSSNTEITKYSIGTYVSGQTSYKVYYVLKKENSTLKISKFIIE